MPAKLEHLDYPEEWAFDQANKTLYLYASDNYTPTSNNVRVRVRDRFMSIAHAHNIEFKNIHFFAGSIRMRSNQFWTIEDSKFSFSTDMLARQYNSSYYGTNATLRNVIFEFINEGYPWVVKGQCILLLRTFYSGITIGLWVLQGMQMQIETIEGLE